MAFLAWLGLAVGTLLVYSARKGTSPTATLRALLSGSAPPDPVYVIEGARQTAEPGGSVGALGKAGGALAWPLPGNTTITSGYGPRAGRMHEGIDIPARTGTPIVAAMGGTVDRVAYEPGGAGHYVRIRHPNGWLTKYFHQVTRPPVAVGQKVAAGQVIGHVGSTGRSSGPHLHFELWIDGKSVDPTRYLGKST